MILTYALIREWKGKVNQFDVGDKKDQHNYKTMQDIRIIQSQKTTEYSREPNKQTEHKWQN